MWTSIRPSNIAVIKYMGKEAGAKNVATNASLSWTLDHLSSKVTLEKSDKEGWQALPTDYPVQLSEKGEARYLAHLNFLKKELGYEGNLFVSSGNNFPSDCGIASSASSFAALTDCAIHLMRDSMDDLQRARLSSKGSGSSCRSFFPGWVLWRGDEIKKVHSPWEQMHHMVVIVGDGKKEVSSSQAHQRVLTSPRFAGRVQRAEDRLAEILQCFENGDWKTFYQITWDEFQDMHSLFETSEPTFSYFLPETSELLDICQAFWQEQGDGPVVTMDAGANVHLMWRLEQKELALLFFEKFLKGKKTCLTNIEEIGFAKI